MIWLLGEPITKGRCPLVHVLIDAYRSALLEHETSDDVPRCFLQIDTDREGDRCAHIRSQKDLVSRDDQRPKDVRLAIVDEDADAAPAIEPVVKGLDDGRGRALEPKEAQRGEHQAGSAVELCDAHVVGTHLSVGFLRRFDHVTSNEIAYCACHLLWMLEQEHMAAALDLAHFATGQSVSERHKPFC
jgi:hypothetical protein